MKRKPIKDRENRIRHIKSIIETCAYLQMFKLLPEELQHVFKRSAILTGGSIASMFRNESVNDYDFYFTNKDDAKLIADYFLAETKKYHGEADITAPLEILGIFDDEGNGSLGITDDMSSENAVDIGPEYDNYSGKIFKRRVTTSCGYGGHVHAVNCGPLITCISEYAITLRNKCQLIFKHLGTPAQIHDHFDFYHCMNYYTTEEGLVLNNVAMDSIETNQLMYNRTVPPHKVLHRLVKFASRGWNISDRQLNKIFQDVNNINIKDEKAFGGKAFDPIFVEPIIQLSRY